MDAAIEQPSQPQGNEPGPNDPGPDVAARPSQPAVPPVAPRRGGYVLPVLCIVSAILIFIGAFIGSLIAGAIIAARSLSETINVVGPGTRPLQLDRTAEYTVLVSPRLDAARPFPGQSIPKLNLSLVSEASGQEIPVTVPPGANLLPVQNGHYRFTIAQPGSYRLTTAYADAGNDRRLDLMIVPDVSQEARPLTLAVLGARLVSLLLVLAGVGLAFRTFRRNGGLGRIG
jgi:hypothetical protein